MYQTNVLDYQFIKTSAEQIQSLFHVVKEEVIKTLAGGLTGYLLKDNFHLLENNIFNIISNVQVSTTDMPVFEISNSIFPGKITMHLVLFRKDTEQSECYHRFHFDETELKNLNTALHLPYFKSKLVSKIVEIIMDSDIDFYLIRPFILIDLASILDSIKNPDGLSPAEYLLIKGDAIKSEKHFKNKIWRSRKNVHISKLINHLNAYMLLIKELKLQNFGNSFIKNIAGPTELYLSAMFAVYLNDVWENKENEYLDYVLSVLLDNGMLKEYSIYRYPNILVISNDPDYKTEIYYFIPTEKGYTRVNSQNKYAQEHHLIQELIK